MSYRGNTSRLTRIGTLAFAALAACDQAPDTLEPQHAGTHITPAFDRRPDPDRGREVERWLAQLRRGTAPYRRVEMAAEAGYDTQITPCMVQEGAGGMGFHYGDPGLIDGIVEPLAPELLLYEPRRNGGLDFVAVEYIVPFTAWTSPEPPEVHGLSFHRNETFGLWVLHAWIWKKNPAGIFSDWNPKVSCRFAAD